MRVKLNRTAGTIFFVFLTASLASAQIPFFQDYPLLKRKEALSIHVIFQDNSGFIWYGTDKGLFKFDGLNQQHYTSRDSLPDDHVTAIAQDSLGRIWTGHRNGKIAYFERGKIIKFDPPEGSASREISDMLFDRQGNLWYSTLNDGLYYYTRERLFRVDEVEGLPDIFVYDILEDPKGNIWAGTDGGVAICTLKDKKLSIKVLDYQRGLPDNIVKKLVIKDNVVWLGTEDAGVFSFDPVTGRTKPILDGEWKFGSLSDFLLSGDQLWIASLQLGLVVYDLNTKESKVYPWHSGVDFKSINTLLGDAEGNVWIGTKSGVTRTLGDQLEYISSFDPYKSTDVLALTVDNKNRIWYSTNEGLFRRTVDEEGKVLIEKPLLRSSLDKYTIVSLYTDSTGYIWAGFYGEGVVRIHPETLKTQYLNKELRNGNVLSITGQGDYVWLGTLGGGTKITILGQRLDIENFSREDGLVSDYIYQVFIDSQSRVWFATDGKGVGMLDEDGFHHYEKGLNSKVVYSVIEDSKKQIWLNVQGEGLYRFDGDTFQPPGKEIQLRDKNIIILSSDAFGNLIIMHDLGIDVYNVERNKIRYLGEDVGIGNKKPNLNALARDANGRIYAGTDQGIIKYAAGTKDDQTSPKPLISGLKVLDQQVDIAGDLSFSHDQNSVVIQYLGFWYQNPTDLNFQYILEKYDRDWIDSRDHSATYSSLPPGEYTFRLRVSDTEDFSNLKETSFKFIIRPPFWKTSWFYLLAIVTLFISGSAYIHYRERKLLEDKKVLEEKVLERTLEIQKQTEEIQAQNEEIQSQAEEIQGINDNLESIVLARTAELEKKNKAAEESAFIIAHELRAPVASLLGLINLISKCELSEETKTIVTHMNDSAEKLNVVVRNITKAIERGDK